MKMHSKAYCFLLFVVLGSAQAFECRIFVDEKDAYSFGAARMGDPRNRIQKKVTKSKECFEEPRKQLYDCEYTDDTGVNYLVNENAIVRKEIRDLGRYQGPLIAGIVANDSLLEVLRKFKYLPQKFPVWWVGADPSGEFGFILGTDYCIQGSNGVSWGYELFFDGNGRLVRIRGRIVSG